MIRKERKATRATMEVEVWLWRRDVAVDSLQKELSRIRGVPQTKIDTPSGSDLSLEALGL